MRSFTRPKITAHHLPRPHADDQDLIPRRRADNCKVGVCGLASPCHPLHREPLLPPPTAKDGHNFQGNYSSIFL